MLITDKPPLERIWFCLRAIHCDASAAQETSANLMYSIPEAFDYLTPVSGQKTITDDPTEFEKKIEALENAAYSGGADLSDIHRYTRLIKGALDQIRKETQND